MDIGVVEAFFGKSWSWLARKDYAKFLKDTGLNTFIYAPKEDSFLRKNWQQEFPKDHFENLLKMGQTFRENNIKWGIGFSPFEIFHDFNSKAQQTLKKKLVSLDMLQPDILGLFFDDMDGNIKDLAQLQIQIINFIKENTNIKKIIFCPTYYSFDPILDKVFGQRPENYLQHLGQGLDKNIDIMWTGPKVCSDELTESHLKEVCLQLGRKPFIWDNYPVNDGPKNCKYLFLSSIKNRSPQIYNYISGYLSNPMNQAYLSQIPVRTIADYLKNPLEYDPEKSQQKALDHIVGEEKRSKFEELIQILASTGLDNLSSDQRQQLIDLCANTDKEWAREILQWLDGQYDVGPECLTQ